MNYFLFKQQTILRYPITLKPSTSLPTRKPFATQKKQDEWELGVLKGFSWWFPPVYSHFHRLSKQG